MRRAALLPVHQLLGLTLLALLAVGCAEEDPLNGLSFEGDFGQPIPLELRGGLLLAEVEVDGGEARRFIVDSGAQYVLLHRPFAEELGYQELINRVGELRLGGMTFHNVEAATWDLSPFSRTLDAPLDGVIGESILRYFTVVLDYQRLSLVLLDGGDEEAAGLLDPTQVSLDTRSAALTQVQGLPLATAAFESAPAAPALLDTGSSATLLLRSAYDSMPNEGRPLLEGATGVGVAGTFTVDELRLCGVALGEAGLAEIPAGVIPDEALGEARSLFPGLAGVIGTTFFREFLVVLDIPEASARFYEYLDRSHIPGDEYTRAGLELQRLDDGRVIVSAVLEGSSAEAEGLVTGDRVLSIDGAPTEGLDRWELDEALLGEAGQVLTLEVGQAGGTILFEVEVEELLPPCEG